MYNDFFGFVFLYATYYYYNVLHFIISMTVRTNQRTKHNFRLKHCSHFHLFTYDNGYRFQTFSTQKAQKRSVGKKVTTSKVFLKPKTINSHCHLTVSA